MKRIVPGIFAFVALGLFVPAHGMAADAPLIPATQFNPAALLPSPPADGSSAAVAEMDELHRIEKARTPAQFQAAKRDDETEDAMAFAQATGAGFDLKVLPQTAKLLDEVRTEEKAATKLAKNYFRRNRPWIADPKLVTCASDDPPQSSYPSGHATMGYSFAVILAALAPQKSQAIMARASDFAENRLVCSMHYRRDIIAGAALGADVAFALLQNPQFKSQFAVAQAELRAAHIIAR